MPKIRVTLGIGYPGAQHEDVVEIDNDDWDDCETQEEKDSLADEYWQEWADNYIDGGWELEEQ